MVRRTSGMESSSWSYDRFTLLFKFGAFIARRDEHKALRQHFEGQRFPDGKVRGLPVLAVCFTRFEAEGTQDIPSGSAGHRTAVPRSASPVLRSAAGGADPLGYAFGGRLSAEGLFGGRPADSKAAGRNSAQLEALPLYRAQAEANCRESVDDAWRTRAQGAVYACGAGAAFWHGGN